MYAITSPTPTPQPPPPDPNAYAYQKGIACEEAGQFADALEWHSRVARGSRFEAPAIASRIAVLLVMGRAAEAAELGLAALVRRSRPSALLVNEVARAVNVHLGPAKAFRICLHYTASEPGRHDPWLWWSTAAYASRCGQFAAALSCLVRWLNLAKGGCLGDLLHDMDLRPLWLHLANDRLSYREAAWLSASDWRRICHHYQPSDGTISFESIGEVPENLRTALRIDIRSMTWRLDLSAPDADIEAYGAWLGRICRSHFDAIVAGFRKARVIQN